MGRTRPSVLGRETTTGGMSIRRTAAIIAAALALSTMAGTAQASSAPILDRIHHFVRVTHHYQNLMHRPPTKYLWVAERHTCGHDCRVHIMHKWRKHAHHAKHRYHRIHKAAQGSCGGMSAAGCINAIFGSYGSQANRVASCESGHSIYAANGQYLGLFQMGSYARARYGYALNVYVQTHSAYRYFVDSGKDWSPWQCKP